MFLLIALGLTLIAVGAVLQLSSIFSKRVFPVFLTIWISAAGCLLIALAAAGRSHVPALVSMSFGALIILIDINDSAIAPRPERRMAGACIVLLGALLGCA